MKAKTGNFFINSSGSQIKANSGKICINSSGSQIKANSGKICLAPLVGGIHSYFRKKSK